MNQGDGATPQTVSEWVAAAQGGDAEAAFRLAGHAFDHEQREAADGWMETAARLGGSAMLWRIADLAAPTATRTMYPLLRNTPAAGGSSGWTARVGSIR